MRVIKPSYEILTHIDGMQSLKCIETCGRICYKSEHKVTEDSYQDFVRNLIKKGHESVLEHLSFSVRFICDRGVSHELVRHRLASYSQESTRYCNYSKDSFNGEIVVIEPMYLQPNTPPYNTWKEACEAAESAYFRLLEWGCTTQEARSVLPTSLKTEVIMTANLREWRHFLKIRCSPAAHPQMRELTIPLLNDLKSRIPVIFEDINS